MVEDDPSTSVKRNKTSTGSGTNRPFLSRKRTFRQRGESRNDNTADETTRHNLTTENIHVLDSWIDPFEAQPGCSLLKELSRDNTIPRSNLSMRGILGTYGKYITVDRTDHFSWPRYDHLTCFLMKPRYNCARNAHNATLTNNTAASTGFALILDAAAAPTHQRNLGMNSTVNDVSTSSFCNLQKFVEDAGGPAGVGRRMLQNYQKTKSVITGTQNDAYVERNQDDSAIKVLLVGTSRFRQIFEALVCGFSDQINDLKIRVGGSAYNQQHKYLDAEKEGLGTRVDLDFVRNGSCYIPEMQVNHTQFFRDDGTIVPKNHYRCNDDIAMAEFGLANVDSSSEKSKEQNIKIRFYYVFRPWAWRNVTPVLEFIGIKNRQPLDFVLWEPRDVTDVPRWQYTGLTDDLGSLYEKIFDIRRTDHPNIEDHDVHELYMKIQKRDIGRYFGADNPWITNPPDVEHPCMPGMPDDKVNFLLWYMLSLSTL